MHVRKLLFPVSFIVVLCSFTFVQSQPTETAAEKQKKRKELDELVVRVLDQSIAETVGLKLSQNRAVVYAMAGDLYWKIDEKRSRELFRSAAAAIVAYNLETEKEKRESTGNDIYTFEFNDPNDVRSEVLPLIAARDAELALDLLIQTRPAALAEAMARAGQPGAKTESDLVAFSPENQRVSHEIGLEQRFAMSVADNDPEKAFKMIKESLTRGVSVGIITMLQKLYRKDEKKALDLGGEAIKKLVDSDLAKSRNDMQVTLNFLQYAALQYAARPAARPDAKEQPFVFNEADIKGLALKLAGVFLQPAKSMAMATMLIQAMPTLEKLVPERMLLLKQRAADNRKNLPDEFKAVEQRQKLWNANSTAEEILVQLAKTSGMERTSVYQVLISKISQITDETRAKKLIDQIPDEKFRSAALEQFESRQIALATGAGRMEDARRMIAMLTNRNLKIQRLIEMAVQTHRKGGEKNVEAARSIMAEAKALTNEFPDNEDDLTGHMEILKGYVTIEPDAAFRLFEQVIEQFNETVQAGAVLSKYNKHDRAFRKGELVMKTFGYPGSGVLLFRFIPHIQMLGKTDLEKMNALADRFARNDSRTIVRLHALQGFLR